MYVSNFDYTPYMELDENQRAVVDSKDLEMKIKAVRLHIGIDKLVFDPDPHVRGAIAEEGIFCEVLAHDPNAIVRMTAAKQGACLEELADDPHPWVRAVVASQIDEPERFIDDADPVVRLSLARRGVALELLADDPVFDVRREAGRALQTRRMACASFR